MTDSKKSSDEKRYFNIKETPKEKKHQFNVPITESQYRKLINIYHKKFTERDFFSKWVLLIANERFAKYLSRFDDAGNRIKKTKKEDAADCTSANNQSAAKPKGVSK
jgi:hypothetical protein